MTRLIVPNEPPPWIMPPKVVEPLVGLRLRTDGDAELLLTTLPAPASEATCWLPPLRSSVAAAATINDVLTGRVLPEGPPVLESVHPVWKVELAKVTLWSAPLLSSSVTQLVPLLLAWTVQRTGFRPV